MDANSLIDYTTVTVVNIPAWRSEIATLAASTSAAITVSTTTSTSSPTNEPESTQETSPPTKDNMQSQKLGLGLGLGIPLLIITVIAVLLYRRGKSRSKDEVYQLHGTSAGNMNSPQMAGGTVKYEMNGASTYQGVNSEPFHELGATPVPSEIYSHR